MTIMTPTTGASAPLIKTDSLGRVRLDKEHQEQILDSFEQSPLSGPRFAELHGIKYQTFATWVQKRKRKRGEYKNQDSQVPRQLIESLVELKLPVHGASEPCDLTRAQCSGLVAEHPSGIKVTIANTAQADLAAVLFDKLSPRKSSC